MSAVIKLWRGGYSLPKAFWGFWALGYFVGRFILLFAASAMTGAFPQMRFSLIVLASTLPT